MTFTIAPVEKVEGQGPLGEFQGAQRDLLQAAIDRGNEIFGGFDFGGIRPSNRQFGITQILPKHVMSVGTITFNQSFTDPGSWTDIYNKALDEDLILGISGFRIPDPTLIFSQLRFEIEDRRFPIIDIEEAQAFADGFDIFLNQDEGEEFIVEGESRFLLRGLQERGTSGRQQRVIPIGFELFKNKQLVITEDEPSA